MIQNMIDDNMKKLRIKNKKNLFKKCAKKIPS